MRPLQILTTCLTVALLSYTVFAASSEGLNFLPAYVEGLTGLGWTGQIYLDLACFSTLSGLWIAWRHEFSPAGVVLGLLAVPGAWLFFGPYLLVASVQARGDLPTLLMGPSRR